MAGKGEITTCVVLCTALSAQITVADRPVTQQGLGGMKTGAKGATHTHTDVWRCCLHSMCRFFRLCEKWPQTETKIESRHTLVYTHIDPQFQCSHLEKFMKLNPHMYYVCVGHRVLYCAHMKCMGMMVSTGPMRQVYDKSYYMGLLR